MMKTAGDASSPQRTGLGATSMNEQVRSKTRQADAGVFDELARLETANRTM